MNLRMTLVSPSVRHVKPVATKSLCCSVKLWPEPLQPALSKKDTLHPAAEHEVAENDMEGEPQGLEQEPRAENAGSQEGWVAVGPCAQTGSAPSTVGKTWRWKPMGAPLEGSVGEDEGDTAVGAAEEVGAGAGAKVGESEVTAATENTQE